MLSFTIQKTKSTQLPDLGAGIHSLYSNSTYRIFTGISEAVCSIIHAAPRTELKGIYHLPASLCIIILLELHVLRDILTHKYGREFSVAVMENRDGCVSDRVSLQSPPYNFYLYVLQRLSGNLT